MIKTIQTKKEGNSNKRELIRHCPSSLTDIKRSFYFSSVLRITFPFSFDNLWKKQTTKLKNKLVDLIKGFEDPITVIL